MRLAGCIQQTWNAVKNSRWGKSVRATWVDENKGRYRQVKDLEVAIRMRYYELLCQDPDQAQAKAYRLMEELQEREFTLLVMRDLYSDRVRLSFGERMVRDTTLIKHSEAQAKCRRFAHELRRARLLGRLDQITQDFFRRY